MLTKRYKCEVRDCGWIGKESEVLRAHNPFDEVDEVYGCPGCKCIGTLRLVCDEPGCNAFSTCGAPDKYGRYRHTCYAHSPLVDDMDGSVTG